MKAKIAALIAAIFFGLFMILPIIGVIKTVKMKKHGILTEATVIDRNTGGKGAARVTIVFNTTDGTEIKATAPKVVFVKSGDLVKVWYDPENPQKIDFGDGIRSNMRTILIIGSISFFLFYIFIKASLKDAANRKLVNTGLKVSTELVSVGRNEKYRMGDKNPWIINCKWTDNKINKEYKFVSIDFKNDPKPFLGGRSHIDVFIDPADPGKYYMDTSFVPAENNFIG
jgi:hypothetical protein